MKVLFLVNPQAGGRGSARAIEIALDRFLAAGWAVTTVRAGSTDQAGEVIRQAPGDGFELLVVAGGDGTVHNAVQHLPLGSPDNPSPLPLGVFPLGSGNDFYRGTGAPREPLRAAENIINGRPVPIDIGVAEPIHDDGSPRDEAPERFANSAGIGIDSQTLVTRLKAPRWLSARYELLFLMTLARMRPLDVILKADEWEMTLPCFWVLCCNTGVIGSGMKVAPGARMDDGILDVLIVHKGPKWRLIKNMPKIFKGTHIYEEGIEVHRARSLTIFTEPRMPFALDGDLTCLSPVRIRTLAGAVSLWTAEFGKSDRN